jgi:hypothetical protein
MVLTPFKIIVCKWELTIDDKKKDVDNSYLNSVAWRVNDHVSYKLKVAGNVYKRHTMILKGVSDLQVSWKSAGEHTHLKKMSGACDEEL